MTQRSIFLLPEEMWEPGGESGQHPSFKESELSWDVIQGDALERLQGIPEESVHCVVTSPPYWGLRDYGARGQIGLEGTPRAWVEKLVQVFREVRRVLRKDGTCWLNVGDCYACSPKGSLAGQDKSKLTSTQTQEQAPAGGINKLGRSGLKPKDLVGIPWRLAFALQDDGWWLRSEIIWAKPNPMPESVRDRPTRSHEYIFLLTKAARYWWDREAVREPDCGHGSGNGYARPQQINRGGRGQDKPFLPGSGRNIRSVWTIPTQPFSEAHFAIFPEELVRRCVRAGCPKRGLVLDPFAGSGTTGYVAVTLGRRFLGIELNPDYCEMARRRIGCAREQMELSL